MSRQIAAVTIAFLKPALHIADSQDQSLIPDHSPLLVQFSQLLSKLFRVSQFHI